MPTPDVRHEQGRRDESLSRIADTAIQEFSEKHKAREEGLRISREVIRLSANTIRAVHRQEFDRASELLSQAADSLKQAQGILTDWPEIYYSGYLSDARKEFSEASITLAIISGGNIPQPEDIGIEMAPYINGMGEVIGELRRYILDSLRRNDTQRCEEFMGTMEDIYSILVTVDFPEAVTSGLRRTTDAMRGILERTRGDLTMALRQRELEQKLAAFQKGTGGVET